MRLIFLIVVTLMLIGASIVHVVYAENTTLITVNTNNVIINQSGTYIQIPVMEKLNTSMADISVIYNDTGVYLTVIAYDPSGVTGTIIVEDPNLNPISTINVNLAGGEIGNWSITLPSGSTYDFIVINATLNNYNYGLYAIRKQMPVIVDINTIEGINPRVGIIILLAPLSPILGIALRGRPQETGISLVALGFFYVPILHAFGMKSPIPEFIGSASVIIGALMFFTSQETQSNL